MHASSKPWTPRFDFAKLVATTCFVSACAVGSTPERAQMVATLQPAEVIPQAFHISSENVSAIGTSHQGALPAVVAFELDGRLRVVAAFHDPRANADAAIDSGMGFAISDDAGEHWSAGHVPMPERLASDLGSMIGAPALAVSPRLNDRGGVEIYYAAVARVPGLPEATHRQIIVARSVDGGSTFLPVMVAAAGRVNDWFHTVDHPSMALDIDGTVHLAFIADAGLPTERIERWRGAPESPTCTFSCMTWEPGVAPLTPRWPGSRLVAPVIRSLRAGLYMAFEQVIPGDGPDQNDTARVVTMRFDPFRRIWVPTSAQPNRGVPFAVAHSDLTPVPHFDFAFGGDDTGFVAWTQREGPGSRMRVQSFRVRTVLEDEWDLVETVRTVPGGSITRPAFASNRGAPTLSWIEEDELDNAVLRGAWRDTASATWSEARDLGAIVNDPMHPALAPCTIGGKWSDATAAVLLTDAADATEPAFTLTVHIATTRAQCQLGDVVDPVLVATRWRAGN